MGGRVAVITSRNNINMYRMVTLCQALKLECKGMQRRGRSVLSIIKQEYGLKGRRQKVYDAFSILVEEAKKDHGWTLGRTQ